MQPTTGQSVQQYTKRQGRSAAIVLALIMGGLAVYGFAMAQVVIPLSNGRMILSGTAAYWAAAGQAWLALGIGSVPLWQPRAARWTVFGALSFALGMLLVWVGTLLQ
jgi:hypothetical protein